VEEPGGYCHGDEIGQQHRHRRIGENGTHIGPHETADEHHRQPRDNNRQGRDDRRVTNLGDCFNRRRNEVLAAFCANGGRYFR